MRRVRDPIGLSMLSQIAWHRRMAFRTFPSLCSRRTTDGWWQLTIPRDTGRHKVETPAVRISSHSRGSTRKCFGGLHDPRAACSGQLNRQGSRARDLLLLGRLLFFFAIRITAWTIPRLASFRTFQFPGLLVPVGTLAETAAATHGNEE